MYSPHRGHRIATLLAGREKGRGRPEDRPLVYPLSPLDGVQLSGNRTLIPPSERSRIEYSGTPSSEPPLTLGVAVLCRLDPRSRRSLLVSEVLSSPRLLSGRYSHKLPVLSPSRACAPWGPPEGRPIRATKHSGFSAVHLGTSSPVPLSTEASKLHDPCPLRLVRIVSTLSSS